MSLLPDFTPDCEAPPFYSPIFHDSFQIGSFVHMVLPSQDPKTTTIVRLIKWIPHGIKVHIFYPLFPKKQLRCHPNPPKHNKLPLPSTQGRNNIELYMSNEVMEVTSPRQDGMPILTREFLHPAFVFSLPDLDLPVNRWSYGVENVFVVRFREHSEHGLVPIPENSLRFMVSYDTRRSHLICHPRSCHLNIWTGLFLIRKALSKMLNRRSGQSEDKETNALSIGMIPVETFNYISMLLSRSRRERCVHKPFKSTETYLDVTNRFTRRKSRITFESGVIRFAKSDDLDKLRAIMGFGATYGSSEIRPTLYHGDKGLALKRGHSLTIVNPKDETDESSPFKRRCKDQRVDLSFSQFGCRVTVSFERYLYDSSRTGILKNPPPTKHLELTLKGQLPLLNHRHQESSTDGTPGPTIPSIIEIDSTSSNGNDTDTSIEEALSPMKNGRVGSCHQSPDGDSQDLSIVKGESFHLDDTVWEILDIFGPHDLVRTAVIEKETGDLYVTDKPEPAAGFGLTDRVYVVGRIPAGNAYHLVVGASAGKDYDDKKDHNHQKTKIVRVTDEIYEAVNNYR